MEYYDECLNLMEFNNQYCLNLIKQFHDDDVRDHRDDHDYHDDHDHDGDHDHCASKMLQNCVVITIKFYSQYLFYLHS